jgi:hypothetical protein
MTNSLELIDRCPHIQSLSSILRNLKLLNPEPQFWKLHRRDILTCNKVQVLSQLHAFHSQVHSINMGFFCSVWLAHSIALRLRVEMDSAAKPDFTSDGWVLNGYFFQPAHFSLDMKRAIRLEQDG